MLTVSCKIAVLDILIYIYIYIYGTHIMLDKEYFDCSKIIIIEAYWSSG